MSAAGLPPLPALDDTMGALLIGGFISCLLLGITTAQLYFYMGRFPNDNIWIKIFVYTIWVSETLQTAFQCHAVYFYLISHYADPSVLGDGVWSLLVMGLLPSLIGGAVEIFFAMRVWKLSAGNLFGKTIMIVIVILSVFHCCLGIVFIAMALQHRDLVWWSSHMKWNTIAGLSSAAAADILIAGSMVYLLRSQHTAYAQTRTLINKLILYSIETGLLTSIWALSTAITFVTMSDNLIATGMLFILPKLYANSLIAMLNSRHGLHGHGSTTNDRVNGSSYPFRSGAIQFRSQDATSSLRSQRDFPVQDDVDQCTLDKKPMMPIVHTQVHVV